MRHPLLLSALCLALSACSEEPEKTLEKPGFHMETAVAVERGPAARIDILDELPANTPPRPPQETGFVWAGMQGEGWRPDSAQIERRSDLAHHEFRRVAFEFAGGFPRWALRLENGRARLRLNDQDLDLGMAPGGVRTHVMDNPLRLAVDLRQGYAPPS